MIDKKYMRKIQATLQSVQKGQKVFFNIAFYEKHGMIKCQNKWGINPVGNKVVIGTKFVLTPKGLSFLNVVI